MDFLNQILPEHHRIKELSYSREESLKYYRDLKNVVDTSREEGLKEGMKKGIEEGIKEGKEQITLQFAREMKANNEPIDKIVRYTGLSKADIEKL